MKYIKNKLLFVLIILVSVYAAFALFGFELFLSGDFWEISAYSITAFVFISIMMVPLVLFCLDMLERIGSKLNNKQRPDRRQHFRLNCFLIMSFLLIVSCIVFYPANMTSDQVDQWIQALGYIPVADAHPAIHTLFLRLCSKIFPSPVTVTIVQSILFAYIVSAIFNKCRERGISYRFLLALAILIAVMPNTIAMITSITKNIMFTILMLWTIYLLMEAFDNPVHFFKSPVFILQSIIVFPFVHMVRHNTFVILPIVLIIFIYFTIKYFKELHIRPIQLGIAVMLMIAVVKGPVYNQIGIVKVESKLAPPFTVYIVPLKFGIELPEDTMSFLEKVLPKEEFIGRYSPYNADIFGWSEPLPDLSEVTTAEAMRHYCRLLIHHPGIVIKERLDGSNLSWDVFSHAGVRHDRYALGIWGNESLIDYMEKESQTFIPERKVEGVVYRLGSGFVTDTVAKYLVSFDGYAFLNSIIWRNGLYLILSLVIAIYSLKGKNYKVIILESIPISVLGTLILVFGCQIYQYFWFFPLSITMLTLYAISSQPMEQSLQE